MLKKQLLLLSCAIIGMHTGHTAVEQNSTFKAIAEAHLKAFPQIAQQEKEPQTPQPIKIDWSVKPLEPKAAYEILYSKILNTSKLESTPIGNKYLLKDLETFSNANAEKPAYVLEKIDRTKTYLGHGFLSYLLATPIDNIEVLKQRQEIIKFFLKHEKINAQSLKLLEAIKNSQNTAFSFFEEKDAMKQLILNNRFFSNNWPALHHLKKLNNSTTWQNISFFKDVTLTGFYTLLPTLMVGAVTCASEVDPYLKYNPAHFSNLRRSPAALAVFGFYQALCLYLGSLIKNNLINSLPYLQSLVIGFADIVHSADYFALALAKHPELEALHHAKTFKKYAQAPNSKELSAKANKLIDLLRSSTFNGKAGYLAIHGRTLAAYSLLTECIDEIKDLFEAVGEVDAYISCAQLYKESQTNPHGYSFAEYVEDTTTPYVHAQDVWHPFIQQEQIVVNSITLGADARQNVILTGPNAGGKSTFLKSLTTSILLAQTIGLVPAKKLVFTPFAKINTYMNISDDTAAGNSLFKSEVMRAENLLNTINTLPVNKFAFSVMDEMFSGTSPKEGEAASYAVAENLGQKQNSILLLATHFPKLTQLEEKTPSFTNYQVRITEHGNGAFSYPFKLEKGKADQNVALLILQQQGFNSSILQSAQNVLNKA